MRITWTFLACILLARITCEQLVDCVKDYMRIVVSSQLLPFGFPRFSVQLLT